MDQLNIRVQSIGKATQTKASRTDNSSATAGIDFQTLLQGAASRERGEESKVKKAAKGAVTGTENPGNKTGRADDARKAAEAGAVSQGVTEGSTEVRGVMETEQNASDEIVTSALVAEHAEAGNPVAKDAPAVSTDIDGSRMQDNVSSLVADTLMQEGDLGASLASVSEERSKVTPDIDQTNVSAPMQEAKVIYEGGEAVPSTAFPKESASPAEREALKTEGAKDPAAQSLNPAADFGTAQAGAVQGAEAKQTDSEGEAKDSGTAGSGERSDAPVFSSDLTRTAKPEVKKTTSERGDMGLEHTPLSAQSGSEQVAGTLQSAAVRGSGQAEQVIAPDGQESASTSESIELHTSEEKLTEDLTKLVQDKLGQTNSMNIVLTPRSLGQITISVVYESGHASVAIAAQNPRTLEMLAENAQQMAQILAARTGQNTAVYTVTPEQAPQANTDAESANKRSAEEQRNMGQRHEREDDRENFVQMMRLGLV